MIRVLVPVIMLTVTSALGVVSAQHQSRKLHGELEREQAREHQLEVEWGQLQLEQSTLAAMTRIEPIARERLGLSEPLPGRVIVVGGRP